MTTPPTGMATTLLLMRPATPLARPRLLEALSGAACTVVEAPAGWGKSTLVRELIDASPGVVVAVVLTAGDDDSADLTMLRRGLTAALLDAGLSDASAVVGARSGADPADGEHLASLLSERLRAAADEVTLVIDDAHLADPAIGAFVRALATERSARIVLCGRLVPEASRPPHARVLTGADLALTETEAAHLWAHEADQTTTAVDAAAGAEALRLVVDGWPAAFALACRHLLSLPPQQQPDELARLLAGGSSVSAVAHRLRDALRPALRGLLDRVSHLELVDEVIVDEIGGPGAAGELRRAGVPWTVGADGWWRLVEAFGSATRGAGALDGECARAAAARYLQRHEADRAVDVLLRVDDLDTAAELVAEHTGSGTGTRDPSAERVAAVCLRLPRERWSQHPLTLLSHAQHLYAAQRDQERAALIEDYLAAALEVQAPPASTLPLRAEQAYGDADPGRGDSAAVIARCQELLAECTPASDPRLMVRQRLLEALAMMLAYAPAEADRILARRHVEEAVQLALAGGRAHRAITSLQSAAYHLGVAPGDFAAADRDLVRALQLSPAMSVERVRLMCFRSEVLLLQGQVDEAEALLDGADRISLTIGYPGMRALAAWYRVLTRARRGDLAGMGELIPIVLDSPIGRSRLGPVFRSEVICELARLGDLDQAESLLAEITPRRDEARCHVALAELAVGVRRHEPDLGQLDALASASLDDPGLEPRQRGRVMLLQWWAHDRAGDRADELARRALEASVVQGADLALMQEPALAQAARERLGESDPVWPVSVTTLGGLSLSAGGRPLGELTGAPGRLVAIVLAHRGQVSIWSAVEALWPEVDPETGRRRLRNVLTRTRTTAGPLVERRGDQLVLVDQARVDAYELLEHAARARRALRADDTHLAEVEAMEAIGLWSGEFLPGADFEAAGALREEVRQGYLTALDLHATHAQQAGRVDDAVRAWEAAAAVEPWNESWLQRAAELLAGAGRHGAARRLAERAVALSEELQVPPHPALLRLVRPRRAG